MSLGFAALMIESVSFMQLPSIVKQYKKWVCFLPAFLPIFRNVTRFFAEVANDWLDLCNFFILKVFFGVAGQRLEENWRRGWDSNPCARLP
ncbi:hypothetical protein [Nitrosomonas sp.]|uniref:hypothetical protein n=1 Tax=Nitrosomonas sp. TaxID=42353 RepID=UPI0035AF34B7